MVVLNLQVLSIGGALDYLPTYLLCTYKAHHLAGIHAQPIFGSFKIHNTQDMQKGFVVLF